MKRLLPLLALSLLFLMPRSVHAEVIHNFQVNASLTSDRRFEVTEIIKYDFEDEEHHGIFRNIPIRYDRDGANYRLRLTDIRVTMDGGKAPFSVSYENDDEVIKIGDGDKYVTGPHVYTIHYVTDRATNFFKDHSEIYWNVTGDGWTVPIEQSSFSISLPPAILDHPATTLCFTGSYGSTETACRHVAEGQSVQVSTTRVLLPGEGFTAVVGIPAGIIRAPSVLERVWALISDNGILAFPVLVFIGMLFLWLKLGRDPFAGTVIPEYEAPDGLLPHEVAAVRQFGDVPARGITASILEMAVNGYLHIRFGEKKGLLSSKKTYTLVKMKESDGMDAASKKLFNGLFSGGKEISTEDFKDVKLYTSVVEFKKAVKDLLSSKKMFSSTWYNMPSGYLVIGFLLMWGAGFIGAAIPLFIFCCFVSGIIIIIFGVAMPKRTPKGAETLRKVKGLELYLTVAEKDRIKFHNAPDRSPEEFLKILPYAVALGVEKQWAEQFKAIDMPPPDWAEGYNPGTGLWAAAFVNDLQSVHAASATGYAPPSSAGSGGSGFSGGGSGGGMGGGGGGSW
ncbi:MAG: DUF2207 domain-containing protein [Patescibacteria group bacterium]